MTYKDSHPFGRFGFTIVKHTECTYSEFDINPYRYNYENIPLFSHLTSQRDGKLSKKNSNDFMYYMTIQDCSFLCITYI